MARWAQEPPADLEGPAADPERVARTILLRRLEAAPRTRAELAATLRQRGVPEDVAVTLLDRFQEVGLVDDRLFARMWVESRQAGRGLSGRALHQELRAKGVAPEVIAEALAELPAGAEADSARALARRRAPALAGLPRATQVRRLSGALARRGYGQGLTAQVVHEVLAEFEAEQAGLSGTDALD